jgi:hypothetical protein
LIFEVFLFPFFFHPRVPSLEAALQFTSACPKKKPNREEESTNGDAPRLGWAMQLSAFPISSFFDALQAALSVACHAFITHHSSLITHHSSLITHHSSLITHHSSLITHHSSLITHHT